MKSLAWSLVVTGAAAVLFYSEGRDASNRDLRLLGAAGGATLAVVAAAWGLARHASPGASEPAPGVPFVPRFFLERRRAPRHDVQIPVRISVNGDRHEATLLCVSARGALLRLRATPGEALRAQVGQPVRIEDYPAGTLARIGSTGVYVDFAVRFEPAPVPVRPAPDLVEAGPTRAARARRG